MAGKKAAGENTKKAAGNAKKSEVANQKAAADNAKKAQSEEQEWSKGAKSNAKKEAEEQKKADAARKKAEKDALLAAEEKDTRPLPKNSKTAPKKTRALDLSHLDSPSPSSSTSTSAAPALNATGIDNALDALTLTTTAAASPLDRHPERRFKAAYAAYEARRLPELETEQKGLRRQQRIEVVRREFERSAENPFNQASARFDSTREEMREMGQREREKVEVRLGGE